MLQRFIGCIILFIFNVALQAQYNCIFKHYSTSDGLSHGQVRTMLKDSKGFMWFGTFDGINRFDGYNFTTYKTRPGDNTSMSSNRIDMLKEDQWGFLWIQTYDSKVYRFDRRTETFEGVLFDSSGNEIRVDKLYKSKRGDFWLYSNTHGLFRAYTDSSSLNIKIRKLSLPGISISEKSEKKVVFMHEDAKRHLWIGWEKELICLEYIKKTNEYLVHKQSPDLAVLPEVYHLTSAAGKAGCLWIGTQQGVLLRIDLKTLKIGPSGFINKAPVNTLRSARGKHLFIGTIGNGIFRFNAETNFTEKHYVDENVKNVLSIFIDSRYLVWLDTDSKGIIRTDTAFSVFRNFSQVTDADPSLQIKTTSTLTEDKNGVLWIALKDGGFGYYNPVTDNLDYFFNEPGNPESKMSNYINSYYVDTSDVMWLCTYFRGLEKITFLQDRFRFIKLSPSATNKIANEVRAIFEDKKGSLWVGSKDGKLHLLDDKNNISGVFSDEIGNGMVYSIIESQNGTVWLGTKGNGLFMAQRKGNSRTDFSFMHYITNPENKYSLSNDMIYSVTEDSKGRIWVGTFGGGINLLEKEGNNVIFRNPLNTFKNYPKETGARIRFLKEDTKGTMWVATTEGLLSFNVNFKNPGDIIFQHYTKIPGNPKSLGNNDIITIHSDRYDTLWLGTMGGGLHKMISYPNKNTPPEFMIYTRENGLPSDVILSIEDDNNGNLWISTENGIAAFNRANQQFTYFDEYDGIDNSTFSEATSCRRASGEIIFGSLDGIYHFHPEKAAKRTINGNMVLTNLRLFNKDVRPEDKGSPLKYALSETSEITLRHNQNMFSIEYVTLDFVAQDKIEYAFILEGFDPAGSGWHYVKNQRIATYTNIPPGEYYFRVKYLNAGLEPTRPGAGLKIKILPPPWKTGWAYALYVLILLALLEATRRIVTTMIRLRNRVVIEREMSDLKLRFFTNISHELRTPLTLILGPLDEITHSEQLTDRGKEFIQLIDRNAKRMLKLINQLLSFRKIQNKKMVLKLTYIDIVLFVREIASNFKELAEEKKINFSINSNVQSLFIWIDEEKTDIVIFNLLSNAFKFTPASRKIELRITHYDQQDYVTIEVRDEGIGIPKEKIPLIFKRFADIHDSKSIGYMGTGIGLSLSKELIDLHNGTISFESTEGKGSVFTVQLKLGKDHFNKEYAEFIEANGVNTIQPPEMQNMFTDITKNPDISLKEHTNKDKPVLLIVEDNADLRKFMVSLFSEKYFIEESVNGAEGYQKAFAILPDLIISDVMMPEMDGIEMTNKLKSDFVTSHIPVILLTAKASVESKVEGLKYGADAYITKPFNSLLLQAQITNLLEQRRLLAEKYINQVKLIDIKGVNEPVITDKDSEFLKTVIGIIEENISISEFRIEDIARSLGMGRTNFFKKIKGLTGSSPIDFVNELRLNKAVQLLESGSYNISEVSYMTGFNDPGYFSKRFKERFKKAPSSFLKQRN
ncbi:MAG: response regulator [Bacteroidales bacterium]|nr:response regulator [Bacteroidales bacterium]